MIRNTIVFYEKDWFIFNDFLLNINVVAAGS
jgi:hypothetical protein